MKEIFDVRRFGKYFRFDLSNAYSNYGFSTWMLGCLPLVVFAADLMVSLIFRGRVSTFPAEVYSALPYVVMIIVCWGAGAKIWGGVTDRRKGTEWITVPASPMEKTLSLLLVSCVVLPLVVLLLLTLSNWILSFLLKDFTAVIPFSSAFALAELPEGNLVNMPLILWLNWCENILFFTLGALCFKRGKVGKSFLCLMGLGFLLSILMMLFFHTTQFSGDWLEHLLESFDAQKVQLWMNVVLNLIYLVFLGGLIALIWARIKTIKA